MLNCTHLASAIMESQHNPIALALQEKAWQDTNMLHPDQSVSSGTMYLGLSGS